MGHSTKDSSKTERRVEKGSTNGETKALMMEHGRIIALMALELTSGLMVVSTWVSGR